jgi:hypothetical protein
MNDKPKLTLSAEELQLVSNADWILTKRKIIDKVNTLFGNLANQMKTEVLAAHNQLVPAIINSSPKIAKGENYLQLPYVILDYPRCFDKENIFAIRTMFWWGNFFSCTIHLSGSYKILFEQRVQKNITSMQESNFYICINEKEWQHHFEADNYIPVKNLRPTEINKIILQKNFIKVAVKFSLHEWNKMNELLGKAFSEIIILLKT